MIGVSGSVLCKSGDMFTHTHTSIRLSMTICHLNGWILSGFRTLGGLGLSSGLWVMKFPSCGWTEGFSNITKPSNPVRSYTIRTP